MKVIVISFHKSSVLANCPDLVNSQGAVRSHLSDMTDLASSTVSAGLPGNIYFIPPAIAPCRQIGCWIG